MKIVFCSRSTYDEQGYDNNPEVVRLNHYSSLTKYPMGVRVEVWDCYKGDTDDYLAFEVLREFGYIHVTYPEVVSEWDDETEGM
jgi:hypothetical protein